MAEPVGLVERIARELGGEDVLRALERLAPRDLHSLLLHLHAQRAEQRSPTELLAAAEAKGLFARAFIDPRVSLRFMAAAFDAATAFEAIELSPVCPLGTIHAISGIHQNNVLSASRGAELVADPTPVLAIECARRRRRTADRATAVRLCTTQRLVRMQPTPAGLLPHFRIFALVTAAQAARAADAEHLREHLAVYLRLFAALSAGEYCFDDVTVSVGHVDAMAARLVAAGVSVDEVCRSVRTQVWADPDALLAERGLTPLRGRLAELAPALAALPAALQSALQELDERVLAPLVAEFPFARVRLDLGRLEGLGYYTGPCVRITARDKTGMVLPLVDGGFTRWTQVLLADRRERFLITGIGSDLASLRLRNTGAGEST